MALVVSVIHAVHSDRASTSLHVRCAVNGALVALEAHAETHAVERTAFAKGVGNRCRP